MSKLVSTFLATFTVWVALPQIVSAAVPPDSFQAGYFANSTLGGDLNLNNTGVNRGTSPNNGAICANIYVFDPGTTSLAPELVSCCSCPIAPNALAHLTVMHDLNGNNLTPGTQNSISVEIVATQQATCDASTPTMGTLAGGLRAWGVTIHALPGGGLGKTENQFSDATLSANQLAFLTGMCGFVQAYAPHGICNTCPLTPGALGGTKQ